MRDTDRGSLWVELLGEVRAWSDGRGVSLGPPKQRALFAMLALRNGRIVTNSEIVDALWGDAPPTSAQGIIHTYVSGLRRALEEVGATGLLVRTRGAYVLQATDEQTDVAVMEAGVAEARRMAPGAPEQAAKMLQECLRRWQGVTLSGASGPLAEAERGRLELLRLRLVEEHAGLLLGSGNHREAIDELDTAVRSEPLRESLRGQLMLALYRSGRQAEALAVFEDGRRVLLEELGIAPGAELVALHDGILSSDPGLLNPASKAGAAPRQTVAPAQLPHTVPDFVGRADELAVLDQWHSPSARGASALVVSAIDGAGGIGKTTLAVHFAREVMADHPDGQLFVNLRGFDPSRPPLTTPEALTQLLRGLGVTTQPDTVDAQVALYRSLLADRNVLIMLDNAVSADQVRDLLPGTSNSLVLVTSRSRLGGLVVRDGARRLTLGLLSPAESFALLRQLVGDRRIDDAPAATATLAQLCGYLPLALRIIGVLVSMRPASALDELAAELAATQNRLDSLSVDDDEMSSVRGVLSWSYQSLKPQLASTFRLLGLHPGPEFGVEAAAVLAGIPVAEAVTVLRGLSGQHLLEQPGEDRYRFHDLVRLYSRELAEQHDSPEVRHQASWRLMVWYLHGAVAAAGLREPGANRGAPVPLPVGMTAMTFDNAESASAWQAHEAPNILALTEQAAELGFDEIAWQLSLRMYSHYYSTGLLTEWIRLLSTGLSAAERHNAQEPQVRLLNQLSIANSRIGNNTTAVHQLEQGLSLLSDTGDDTLRATTLGNLASTLREMGRYDEGLPYALKAVTIAQRSGLPYFEAGTLDVACQLYVELGQPEKALIFGRAGLAVARTIKLTLTEANLLVNVGHAYRDLGQFDRAIAEYENALSFCRSIGDRYHEGLCLLGLARENRRRTREDLARSQAEQALEIFVEIDAEEAGVASDFLRALAG
nr:AfsR/SARP family transcriptional regulator [Amycolatopsis antarctica]